MSSIIQHVLKDECLYMSCPSGRKRREERSEEKRLLFSCLLFLLNGRNDQWAIENRCSITDEEKRRNDDCITGDDVERKRRRGSWVVLNSISDCWYSSRCYFKDHADCSFRYLSFNFHPMSTDTFLFRRMSVSINDLLTNRVRLFFLIRK